MSEKSINDKSLGTAATHARCCGAANNQIKKGPVLSTSVYFIIISWVLQSRWIPAILCHHLLRGVDSVRLQILFVVCCWPQSQEGDWVTVQVSMTWALTCPETVHQRPCMTREIETWLSDSRVGNNSVVDNRSRRPVLSPLRNCVYRCHIWPYWASRCKPWRWTLSERRKQHQWQ